jgi:hypothetical protein
VILAALHDLALAGRAPALAAAYAAADGDAAAGAAVDTLLRMTGAVVAVAVRRPPRAGETGHCAVLYPAIAEAARRAGATAVGLIDVGCSAAAGRGAECWRGWPAPSARLTGRNPGTRAACPTGAGGTCRLTRGCAGRAEP